VLLTGLMLCCPALEVLPHLRYSESYDAVRRLGRLPAQLGINAVLATALSFAIHVFVDHSASTELSIWQTREVSYARVSDRPRCGRTEQAI